jgi:hypothetical protein
MNEDNRLAVRANLRRAAAENAGATSEQIAHSGAEIIHLVTNVMDATKGISLQKGSDRRR